MAKWNSYGTLNADDESLVRSMARRFWLAVLAYVVPTFPLGYLWHLTIFADRYHELAMYREQVIIPMGIASMLVLIEPRRAQHRSAPRVACSAYWLPDLGSNQGPTD